MNKSLLFSLFILSQLTAKTVIESDYSQFNSPYGISCGPTACTPTYLQAASYILNNLNPWEMNQKDLETFLSQGSKIFALTGKDSTKSIPTEEILVYVPQIEFDSSFTGFTTLPLFRGALSKYDIYGILKDKGPTCSIFTRQEKDYLICHKNNYWTFVDIQQKQDGSDGSHMIIFKNDKEFLTFLDENKIFEQTNLGTQAEQFELYVYKSSNE